MSRFIAGFLSVMAMTLVVQGQIIDPISISGDSLAVNPARPTTADPIVFSIIIPNWDCCTRYHYDSTAVYVSDTQIILSYQYELPQNCPMIMCIDVDKVLRYKSSPLPAGKYAVYESRQLYCAGPICPVAMMMPVKIGEITVSTASRVVFAPKSSIDTRRSSAGISSQLFTLRGEAVRQGSKSVKPVGIYIKSQTIKSNSVIVR
jgi:hypothetical protein